MPSDGVTDAERAAWQKVATCEEGGANVIGALYSGYFGVTNANWIAYGGGQFAANAYYATFDQQIIVAERIQSSPPDQNGCSGGW